VCRYAVEKTLKSTLVARGVPVSVYPPSCDTDRVALFRLSLTHLSLLLQAPCFRCRCSSCRRLIAAAQSVCSALSLTTAHVHAALRSTACLASFAHSEPVAGACRQCHVAAQRCSPVGLLSSSRTR
jgi:hypothetical protein